MKKIPQFQTLEEAADFWDAHDFEDYVEQTEPVKMTVRIPRRRKILTIPIDLPVYERIEALAARRRVSVETLVARWLREKALAETMP